MRPAVRFGGRVAVRLATLMLAALLGLPCVLAATVQDGRAAVLARRFDDAFAIWSDLASRGDPQAALELGGLYDLGQGTRTDPAAALHWYQVAAESGLPAAELDVGLMYDLGRGAARDAGQAALWYARAAVRGNLRGAYNLGQLYESGDGVPHNDDLAADWYRAAAAGGLAAAAQHLQSWVRTPPAPATKATDPMVLAPDDGAELHVGTEAPAAELVWTLSQQLTPPKFFVEVVALSATPPKRILASYVAASATLVRLPAATGSYAWRLYVVSAGTQSYAPSPWRRFTVAALPAPGAGQGVAAAHPLDWPRPPDRE